MDRPTEAGGAPDVGPSSSALAPKRDYGAICFADLCELFEAIQGVNERGSAGAAKKRKLLDGFNKEYGIVDGPRIGAFEMYRLILPTLDKERAAYSLKENALAYCIGNALGLKRGESEDFNLLENWRTKGKGIFVETVYTVCCNHGKLSQIRRATIANVNASLDLLSQTKGREEKVKILRALMDNMDARQIRWLAAIILKDLKLGYGESAIMRNFHDDAEAVYNVCCDLRRVCETLQTRNERFKRQDVQPGQNVKAMKASRANGCNEAFKVMHRKSFVIETKFDGERIQVHRCGPDEFKYFTRNNNDFGLRGYKVLDRLFKHRLAKNQCVLDGELVVWNKRDKTYAPFGYVKGSIKAANEAMGGDEACVNSAFSGYNGGGDGQDDEEIEDEANGGKDEDEGSRPRDMDRVLYHRDIEIIYIAFDVLYDEDHSVIDRPLVERHEVLRNMFKPLPALGASSRGGAGGKEEADKDSDGHETDDGDTSDEDEPVYPVDGSVRLGPVGSVVRGKLFINVPATLENHPENPENPHCVVGHSLSDIEDKLWERIDSQEEGLIIKDLSSKWAPGGRDKAWLKIKPEYLATEDLDCVIIGGYYGTGMRRGGKISEYLLGIVKSPSLPGTSPSKVISFSKVGTGMSEELLKTLREKLNDHMVPAGKGHPVPNCYEVTGATAETPHVWIEHPSKSIVLTVKADIRLVPTKTFVSEYSLRFPRVTGVRWDKPWHEVMTDEELCRKVKEEGGIAVSFESGDAKKRRKDGGKQPSSGKRAKTITLRDRQMPGHLAAADTSHVERHNNALKTLDVRIITGGSEGEEARRLKQSLTELVYKHGGVTSEVESYAFAFWKPCCALLSLQTINTDTVFTTLPMRHLPTYAKGDQPKVTHVVATRDAMKGAQCNAVVKKGGMDILTPEWLGECVAEGHVIDPRPRHRLHLSRCTVDEAKGEMDAFGDRHDVDVNIEDVTALMSSHRATSALKAMQVDSDLEAGIGAIRQELAAVAANNRDEANPAEGLYRIFSGCTFLVVLLPAGKGAGGGSVAGAAQQTTDIAGTEPLTCLSPAMQLIMRNSAGPPSSTAVTIPMGESRRLARTIEMLLQLRGGVIARVPAAHVTHVVAVTPSTIVPPTNVRGPGANLDVDTKRALDSFLLARASPQKPKKERCITESFLNGGGLMKAQNEDEGRDPHRGTCGSLLSHSVQKVTAAWVFNCIASGQPVSPGRAE